MDAELNAKEVAFNKIIQWLAEYRFKIEKKERSKDKNSEIQFDAKVYPPNQDRLFFSITFSRFWVDSFAIGATLNIPEDISFSIDKVMKKSEKDQIFIDIDRMLFPLSLSCDFKFPQIYMHKLIFIDALKDKQFFFDSVYSLVHGLMLVEGKFDELINRFLPKE